MNDSLLEEGDVPDCPACGGPGVILGKLGNRWHFRCRGCGIDYSEEGGICPQGHE
ncbi:MAG: hypothetical protein J5I35_05310 [Methanothrix harundinacea]|nr:hypothetical protein [Methanothrix harundinacea]